MPRTNPPRELFAEPYVAARVASEREARGWSYEGLAKRMTDVGCAIQSSAIYKIEKSNPPRRITVDELVGFAKVFELAVEELLVAPDLRASAEAIRLLETTCLSWTAIEHNKVEAFRLRREFDDQLERLHQLVSAYPDSMATIEARLPVLFPNDGPHLWKAFIDSIKKEEGS